MLRKMSNLNGIVSGEAKVSD